MPDLHGFARLLRFHEPGTQIVNEVRVLIQLKAIQIIWQQVQMLRLPDLIHLEFFEIRRNDCESLLKPEARDFCRGPDIQKPPERI